MAEHIDRRSPYDAIAEAIEKWCEKNMYTTMLVTISIGYEWEKPHEETHILEWDGNECVFIWDIDWWEGQQSVSLVGFAPVYKIRLRGENTEIVPGRDFRDCRNELCLRCGDYKNKHLGACDGCRWEH